ncbi:hypothetical protein [Leifsonia sp. fls2-241-R2A-40a]|uniref:hypothetical protein n=1 Tax=Leifsonia sp. fls2-241-R2A-40a TaxID=3040290 RepID=UPI0025513DE9|nr:hypothetical protein [Leifsonia sp. fls2-241-R2A-40a]
MVSSLVIGAAFIAVYVGIQRDPQPLHLPVAVASEQLATAAQQGLGDKVTVTEVSSLEEGARMVRNGDAVAAVGLSSRSTLQVDYAGAKGLSESGAARALVHGLAAHAGLTVHEQDVVPLVKYDSRGLSAFYVVFGVTLASFVLAQGLTGAAGKVRLRHRLYAMGGFAVVIGVVAATIAGPVLGALNAPWIALAASLSLLSAAVAFTTKALGAWLGAAGIGLAVLALTTVGNAVSGATIGYDILPRWAQVISPILPPGAAFRAVNEFGYFDGSSAWSSLVVLAIWAIVGFGLVLVRSAVAGKRSTAAAASVQSEPVAVS